MFKKCSICKKNKPFSEYGRHNSGAYGLKARCRECLKEIGRKDYKKDRNKINKRNKAYYARNKKLVTEINKKWASENIEKRRQIARDYYHRNKKELAQRQNRFKRLKEKFPILKILASQNGACFYCGKRNASFAYDHILPISKGGLDTLGNLVASCKSCNSKKKNMLVIEFKRHSLQMGYKLML